jgi:hypothetical protein
MAAANGPLSQPALQALVDFEAARQRVRDRLASLKEPPALVRFFVHYASWNGHFANGVAALASLLGNGRDLFREAGLPRAVSDRSNYIASYFFDAARDEYDDHINPARDSHRCMAQASLLAMAAYFKLGDEALDGPDPAELQAVNDGVMAGYTGQPGRAQGPVAQVFWAIGYHLGSELLADQEFSIIDEHLRQAWPELVHHLMRTTVELAGGQHRCYAWVGVHSGHGGGVEADHFDYALDGARGALRYLAAEQHAVALQALEHGFRSFEQDHARFFAIPA